MTAPRLAMTIPPGFTALPSENVPGDGTVLFHGGLRAELEDRTSAASLTVTTHHTSESVDVSELAAQLSNHNGASVPTEVVPVPLGMAVVSFHTQEFTTTEQTQHTVASIRAAIPLNDANQILSLVLATPSIEDWTSYCRLMIGTLKSLRIAAD